ncbi:hypothetical protein HZB90_02980 [archaeon]|nr:hypothetical protein [archaeon]
MKRWMHKIEVIVDKAIAPCLVLLLAVIVLELGMHDFVVEHGLQAYISIADYIVITIFVMDLVFKYLRTKHIPLFLRKYWMDILAVFPFFLMFRFYEVTIGLFSPTITEGAETAQMLLHEGLEVEKEGTRIVREAEKIAKEAERAVKVERSTRFARFLRPLFRSPRFLKAAGRTEKFYEKPKGEHHQNEYMPKAIRK